MKRLVSLPQEYENEDTPARNLTFTADIIDFIVQSAVQVGIGVFIERVSAGTETLDLLETGIHQLLDLALTAYVIHQCGA